MNGSNYINTGLLLLQSTGSAKAGSGQALPNGEAPRSAAQEAALSANLPEKAGRETADNVLISQQAKERLRFEEAIKLETPPHITTVKEHVQELAERSLRPAYENGDAPEQTTAPGSEPELELGGPAAETESESDEPVVGLPGSPASAPDAGQAARTDARSEPAEPQAPPPQLPHDLVV